MGRGVENAVPTLCTNPRGCKPSLKKPGGGEGEERDGMGRGGMGWERWTREESTGQKESAPLGANNVVLRGLWALAGDNKIIGIMEA